MVVYNLVLGCLVASLVNAVNDKWLFCLTIPEVFFIQLIYKRGQGWPGGGGGGGEGGDEQGRQDVGPGKGGEGGGEEA